MTLLATIGLIVQTVSEFVSFIRWLDGEDEPRPVFLSKLPAATESAVVRIRARSRAAKAFGASSPPI